MLTNIHSSCLLCVYRLLYTYVCIQDALELPLTFRSLDTHDSEKHSTLTFLKVDVDKNEEAASKANIRVRG